MTTGGQNKFAVVTGATGGIGRAICGKLARTGHNIIGQFHRNVEGARELERAVLEIGVSCHMIACDLSSPAELQAFSASVECILDQADEAHLALVVNNAAKLLGPAFGSATADNFDEYFSINTRAPLLLTQQLSALMTAGGSIVNISSANAHFSSPGDIVYAMSKAALESFTANAAEALSRQHIRVNTVIPGFTDNGHPAFRDPSTREYMSTFAVLGDVGTPELVAEAVAFLGSEASSRTTGTALDISGGSTLGARGTRAQSIKAYLKTLDG